MPLPATYQDNSSSPAPPATVGVKISKPGYPADRTGGQNMIFDSSWPSLPVAFETTITNPITSSSSFATIPHNLGFAPFCMGWYYGPDSNGLSNTSSRFALMSDTTNLYLYGNQSNTVPFTATKIKLRAFQIDLNKDIDYTLAPGDTFNFPYDNNYGLKLVKQNKDINSTDLRDYSVHSRAQSPLIQAVKTQATVNPANTSVVQYTSKAAYPVWVYGFIRMGSTTAGNLHVPTNTYLPAALYSQSYPRVFTDGFTSYLQFTASDNGATLVVLRDPMFAATQTTVQY